MLCRKLQTTNSVVGSTKFPYPSLNVLGPAINNSTAFFISDAFCWHAIFTRAKERENERKTFLTLSKGSAATLHSSRRQISGQKMLSSGKYLAPDGRMLLKKRVATRLSIRNLCFLFARTHSRTDAYMYIYKFPARPSLGLLFLFTPFVREMRKSSHPQTLSGREEYKKFAAGCSFGERDLGLPFSQFNIFAAWKNKKPAEWHPNSKFKCNDTLFSIELLHDLII